MTDSQEPSEGIEPRTSAQAAEAMDRPLGIGAQAHQLEDALTAQAREQLEHTKAALHRRINNDFTYHPPPNPEVTLTYKRIRDLARSMAHELVELVPPGRELSRALSDLEDCVMHANAGVARSGGKP